MRIRRITILAAMLCFVVALAAPTVASATVLPPTGSSTNEACLGCHAAGSTVTGVQVDFGVGVVDKATACNKCHWISPHPVHNATASCADGICHRSWDWGVRTDFWVSQTTPDPVATGSYFNSTTSVNTSPDELHRIHTRRSWIAELADYNPKCAGCHAAASCDACHQAFTMHGQHGVAGDPAVGEPTAPIASNLTRGIPVSATRSASDYTFYGQSACIASGCHAGVAPGAFIDDTGLTYTGVWTTVTNPALVGGSYTYSTSPTATFEVSFTGTGITWVGQRANTGGISEVYVDGVLKKTVNLFYGAPGFDRHVSVLLGLPYGEHTLTVKNTALTSYYWNHIFVQGVRVYGVKPDFAAAPDCADCHAQHGDLADRHSSTWGMEGCTAASCHLTNELAAEHDKWRPTDTCALCHGTAVSTTVAGAVDGGVTACDACHTSLLTESAHHSLHNAASVTNTGCKKCHNMYLDTEHANRGLTCATCHDTSDPLTVNAIATGDRRCTACHGAQPHRNR